MQTLFIRGTVPVLFAVLLTWPPLVQTAAAAPASSTSVATSTSSALVTTPAQIYFTANGKLAAEARSVSAEQPARGAVEQLEAGPGAGYLSEVPPLDTFQDISVSNDVAYVSFTHDFFTPDGALGMQLRLAQVVFTLTQFPTIQSVQFLEDGQVKQAADGDGFPISMPLARQNFKALA